MFKEARNWLKIGIEKKDKIGIQLAQTMLDGSLLFHTEQKKESPGI
jgi:hypothetical protein